MECPHIPLTSYADFGLRMYEKAISEHIPLTGSIEITERCNLDCAHCYINQPAGARQARESELTFHEWCNVIDQIVDEGVLWLLFSGGEPFVRPDFLDIYTHAKRKGLLVTLFTNGTTITPRIADYLAEWSPFRIEITLYGHSQETYERVTGVPGSYKKCIRGIELLLERDLPLSLKSMVLTLNQHEIWEMQAFAEKLGVGYRFDPILNLRLDGGHDPAAVRISPQDVVSLDLADEKRLTSWLELTEKFWGPPINSEKLYQCGAGKNTFHIDAEGQLSVCMLSRSQSYSLRTGSFRAGWREFIPQVLAQKWERETSCKHCELIALCGQCPGAAHIENGDQNTPVAYLCEIAHQRAQAFGLTNDIEQIQLEASLKR